MGNTNSSTKESRTSGSRSRPGNVNAATSNGADPNAMYSLRSSGRGSRQNLSFLHLSSNGRGESSRNEETRRETKQEREARRREKERLAREKERERSMREESVDGGFLVTLGTYTGPEDFNKAVVRQLMIERRLAPFWKGLNDHNDSWTENQLVAVARGLPLPAPDDPPLPDPDPIASTTDNTLALSIASRSLTNQSDEGSNQQGSNFLRPGSASLPSASGSRNLFRDRAKTLASLGTSTKGGSSTSIAPQEVQLPRDPRVNGSPVEAVLYKDAAECPICFMYYPPYLNKTRCCDQPICSECFVQIKRPDPHPPEHHDEDGNPTTDEEGLLVSEVAACPFCVTPEFGVSYDPPPFRRGLVYPGPVSSTGVTSVGSPGSSSTSVNQLQGRRRTTSLSASAPTVITTDRVRPDWAKKLADARAHALRRSAAATALHNAAYMLGNSPTSESRSFGGLGRRRRTLLGESSANASGTGTPRIPENTSLSSLSQLIAQIESQAAESRASGRRTRTQDLEDLMMMEAIRLSLASEEDRKKKEEKEIRKDAKKREKEAAKEAKKADKAAKKSGSIYSASLNGSTTFSSMSRSTSNIPRPQTAASVASSPPPATQPIVGKGKAPATYGFNPLSEPTSTLNTESAEMSSHAGTAPDDAQRHLEESRAKIPQSTQPISFPEALNQRSSHLRHISNASSVASSMMDSAPGSYQRSPNHQMSPNASGTVLDDSGGTPDTQGGTPGNDVSTEPMFNFNTMSERIQSDDKDRDAEHVEFYEQKPDDPARNTSVASSSKVDANGLQILNDDEREVIKHGDALPIRSEETKPVKVDAKHAEDVNILHNASATTH